MGLWDRDWWCRDILCYTVGHLLLNPVCDAKLKVSLERVKETGRLRFIDVDEAQEREVSIRTTTASFSLRLLQQSAEFGL